MEFERRAATKKPFIEGRTLVGMAAMYNTPAELPGFTEVIAERAFDGILATNPEVVCLFNHDPNFPLGRTTAGTLKLYADHRGLNFSVELPDTSWGNDVYKSVQRGDIAGCSFAFQVDRAKHEKWDQRGGKVIRTITGFSGLQDVSPVTFPVYKETSVDARSITAETRSMAEQVKRQAPVLDPMMSTMEFVAEELGVPLFWINTSEERPFKDQLELIRMAVEVFELRSRGYEIEVRHAPDTNWPTPVYVGPVPKVRKRSRYIDFILNL